jgi:hypothetical protein
MPDLREAIRALLVHVTEKKEIERHMKNMAKRNEKIKREARKTHIERMRMEKGSDYETERESQAEDDLTDSSGDSSDEDSGEEGSTAGEC